MRRFLFGVLGLAGGYAIGVGAGLALVALFSPNMHDKSVEMAMTSAFVTGPLGAVAGLIAGIVLSRRKPE